MNNMDEIERWWCHPESFVQLTRAFYLLRIRILLVGKVNYFIIGIGCNFLRW